MKTDTPSRPIPISRAAPPSPAAAGLPIKRVAAALSFFLLSFYIFYLFGGYHAALPLQPGDDLVLRNIPRWDWMPLLTYGWLAFHVAAFSAWARLEPRRIPYYLAAIGLFMCIRNVFVVLTPYGQRPDEITMYSHPLLQFFRGTLVFDNELFFSGHTGTPFLYFLMSRRTPRLRLFFLGFSVLMGAGVLLTRNHYAIDVLGAYFITYAIYRLSLRLFPNWESAGDKSSC